jgi:hypothetical protein
MTPKISTAYRIIAATSQDISVPNGSAAQNSTALANASKAPLGVLRFFSTVNCRVAIGQGVSATATSTFVPANTKEYFSFNKGDRISVYGVGGTGTANITECSQ